MHGLTLPAGNSLSPGSFAAPELDTFGAQKFVQRVAGLMKSKCQAQWTAEAATALACM